MSTVLWANCLINGKVESDQSDKYALYKHLSKLDKVCKSLGLAPLSALCDSIDAKYNVEDIELPKGMTSTDELMARDGVWVEAGDAARMLEKLLAEIMGKQIRFGLINNDHESVVAELKEAMEFAKEAAAKNAKFNLAMVM